ncbi:MAG: hypothetical protein R3248_07350 [Candidatus Promineifilaceae bacterium]|nr:hypothetical protein [Candidatus Promineifilaceae bacterium]
MLIVEVIAVLGLLASAVQMWNVRQELQQDLLAAKEAEAALGAREQPSEPLVWNEDAPDAPAEPFVPPSEDAKTIEDDGRSSLLLSPSLRSLKESRKSLVNVSTGGNYCFFCAVLFAR